jgi:hypothetical protein
MSMSLMPAHTMPYHYVGGAGGIIWRRLARPSLTSLGIPFS